jgi:AcrR family transcriptional regulator
VTDAQTTSPAPPRPRQLMARAERRASLLRGAARAFARSGFAGTSMDDVAAAAGVSRLIVYRHFDSKEELYRATIKGVSDRLAEEWVQGVTRKERGVGVRSLLTVAREDPDGFVLLWRHAAREPAFAGYAAEHREDAKAAAMLYVGGMFGDPRVEHWAAGVLVSTLVEGVLAWLEEGDPSGDEAMAARLTSAVGAMLRAWGAFRPAP